MYLIPSIRRGDEEGRGDERSLGWTRVDEKGKGGRCKSKLRGLRVGCTRVNRL